mmetsp:Transcript_42771/g.47598  ORF Transcript_42771/g.47598 Transcript_42771/m.47598 type:complete len:294 (-) Transcript_42771:186-1067(-)|eukprot:CAMPEP_0171024604 /NCGR_PEP_ID=MMETSP0736-20130129/33052_1 /TAXON_ID=186038 /ORGANISM="Fragilariopsis kerguelensis, Strain L26-C5" /LENGTH=293 /DNA_ID=CAMNT_0011464513 /DNA_START=66 /DNA_END=947 /DNA_ORIENTATION=-
MNILITSTIILSAFTTTNLLFAGAEQLRGNGRGLESDDLSHSTFALSEEPLVELAIEHKLNSCFTDDECRFTEGETCMEGKCTINLVQYVKFASPSISANNKGGEETSFSVDYKGVGSLSGLTFTVPAHSETKIVANLRIAAMTSQNIRDLEAGWTALLDISRQEELREYKSIDASLSANLSFMGFFSGGGKTENTMSQSREYMEALGLSESQIDDAMTMFSDFAKEMSEVTYDCTIFNRNNPYSVSGMLQFFVMSGEVTTGSETVTWRTFSDGSVAGEHPDQANGGGEMLFL